MSQTPVSQRNFSGPGRTAPSEWPQFQGVRPTDLASSPSTDALSSERLRSVTQPSETLPGSERSSPRPNRGVGSSGGVGTLPLPLPRNSGTGTVPGSGRTSPVQEKKLGGSGLEGLGKPPLTKGYSSSELGSLGHSQAGYVDNLTDQFSNVSKFSLLRFFRFVESSRTNFFFSSQPSSTSIHQLSVTHLTLTIKDLSEDTDMIMELSHTMAQLLMDLWVVSYNLNCYLLKRPRLPLFTVLILFLSIKMSKVSRFFSLLF